MVQTPSVRVCVCADVCMYGRVLVRVSVFERLCVRPYVSVGSEYKRHRVKTTYPVGSFVSRLLGQKGAVPSNVSKTSSFQNR